MNKKFDRFGEININYQGREMKIINYINARHIDVEFINSGYIVKNREYKEFEKGKIKDLYAPEIYGIGFLGEKYSNKDFPYFYKKWNGMIERCYSKNKIEKCPTYSECSVCEEWKSFSNFCEWCINYYYEIPNEEMHLDKDILVKGNKIYSPNTCIFTPQRINKLFLKHEKDRGNYVIGVSYNKNNNKFIARCNIDKNKRKQIGTFNTEIGAFQAYKEFKENYIKQVADEYKQKYPQFPKRLYEAMYNYVVEITD